MVLRKRGVILLDYLSFEESYNTFTAKTAIGLTTQAMNSKEECYYDYIHDSIIKIYQAIRAAARNGRFSTSITMDKFYFSRHYKEDMSLQATFERICKEIAKTFEDKDFFIRWIVSEEDYDRDPKITWRISW